MNEIGKFDRVSPVRREGSERFLVGGQATEFDLTDFWRWSVSDLVSNATRGRLAEYIVARALDISTSGVRDEWAACDLCTECGDKIEVKSAAYLQSWHQTKPSTVLFSVKKARSWDSATNALDPEPTRSADVYVFALLHHIEKTSLDPMNLDQWCFFVLPTSALDKRERSQHSITLQSLRALTTQVDFSDLRGAVDAALGTRRTA